MLAGAEEGLRVRLSPGSQARWFLGEMGFRTQPFRSWANSPGIRATGPGAAGVGWGGPSWAAGEGEQQLWAWLISLNQTSPLAGSGLVVERPLATLVVRSEKEITLIK